MSQHNTSQPNTSQPNTSQHGTPESDNRRATRVERINLVQVSRFDEDGFNADLTTGRTLNLSRTGLRLELHHALPLRSHVRLDLAIGDHLIAVDGTVVYLEALPGDRCAMGISFHDVEPAAAELLDSVVDQTAA